MSGFVFCLFFFLPGKTIAWPIDHKNQIPTIWMASRRKGSSRCCSYEQSGCNDRCLLDTKKEMIARNRLIFLYASCNPV